MKTDRSPTIAGYLILTGLAICFSAARLSAENWKVTFSLPSETHWGEAVLPAGSYCLRLDTFAFGRPMQIERRASRVAIVILMAKTEETPAKPGKSELLLVRDGNKSIVHILYIADIGTEFHFNVPEQYEVHTRLIARADEPVFIQRIPVIVSGK